MNNSLAVRSVDGLIDDEAEIDSPRFSYSVGNIAESLRNIGTLSEALRVLGAAVLLASMSVFLLQGWSEGNDIRRYLMLLAQTSLLTAAGFALSHGLKETKGARIFFGLALVSIPANFTILGALLYSVFQWDSLLVTYPDFANWRIEDVTGTGILLGGALVVLLPVTMFCFAIMARHSARALSLHFLFSNLLLLLPIRNSIAAGTIALLGTLYALYVGARLVGRDRALKTGEGKFALATLFLPAGIILFRSMYFYQIDSLLIAMLSLAVFLAARQASLFPDRRPGVALVLDVVSVPLALLVAVSVTDAFGPTLIEALYAPVFAVVYSALALDVLRRTDSHWLARGTGVTISLLVSLSFILSVWAAPGALSAILCLGAGALMLAAGLTLGNTLTSIAGVIAFMAGAVLGFDDLLRLVVSSTWIDLAVVGASAIALGSVLDRHGVSIKLRVIKWLDGMGERTT